MDCRPLRSVLNQCVLLVTILVLVQPAFASSWKSDATTSQFKDWYPQYGFVFERAMNQNCTDQYNSYSTRVKNTSMIDWYGGGDVPSALTQPVILCILDSTSDYIKSAMASAQVLLGVTPTILALLGASAMELSMVSVVAKRPFLSLLLALGSPSVFVSRAFEYADPVELLQDRRGRLRQNTLPSTTRRRLVSAAQYATALAAVGNIAALDWQLGVRTVCSFWPDNVIGPILWSLLVVVAHVSGGVILRLQIRRTDPDAEALDGVRGKTGTRAWFRGLGSRIVGVAKTEFRPAASQGDIYITAFPERKWFVFLSWALSTCVIVHVIYGTLVFSSLYFIGPRDAISVVGRYMSSVLVCRIIVMYEIAGIRERCQDIVLKYNEPKGRERYEPWDSGNAPVLAVSTSLDSYCVQPPK